jgi:hypothetical protein
MNKYNSIGGETFGGTLLGSSTGITFQVPSNSGLIYKKMTEVMKDIGAIGKGQKNSMQGYSFRGIDDMLNALYPALTRHGVFMAPRARNFSQELRDVTRSNGKAGVDKHVSMLVEYDFIAEDGSKVTVGPIPAEGVDSGDKATNKALSAALKYALIQTFSIPTQDMEEADRTTLEIGVSSSKSSSKQETQASESSSTATQSEASSTTTVEPMKKSTFRKPSAKTTQAQPSEEGWN